MRQLAKIVRVDDIRVHPNADRLEIAVIGLWNVVVSKGQFTKDDSAIFCEIDSLLPIEDERLAFLAGRNEYAIDGKQYSRLKTMRLRKVLSQGLLLPCSQFGKEITQFLEYEDEDVTLADALGIIKYEPPEDSYGGNRGNGAVKGHPFPYFIPKTDQERIQNLVYEYNEALSNKELFEVTFKLDGSSITIAVNNNAIYICSRNNTLTMQEDWNEIYSHYIRAAIDSGILFKLILINSLTGRNLALQGELCGPKIQSNFEGLDKDTIFIYDVYDIDNSRYLLPDERIELLYNYGLYNDRVPVYLNNALLADNINDTLVMADGKSALNGKFREGLVFKSMTRDFSFKAIGNSYLEKTGK